MTNIYLVAKLTREQILQLSQQVVICSSRQCRKNKFVPAQTLNRRKCYEQSTETDIRHLCVSIRPSNSAYCVIRRHQL